MYIVVCITAAHTSEARAIAQALVRKKLAACVNIIEKIESFFWWQKKLDRAREVMLVVKTKKKKFAALVRAVRALHSYDVPEIIALPIVAADKPYLDWIDGSLR